VRAVIQVLFIFYKNDKANNIKYKAQFPLVYLVALYRHEGPTSDSRTHKTSQTNNIQKQSYNPSTR
jgi:hypothetical protein